MSVAKMKVARIIGKFSELDRTIAACINSGCFHAENAAELVADLKGFTHVNDENPYKSQLTRLTDTMKATGLPLDIQSEMKNECLFTPDEIADYLEKLQENLGKLHEERSELHKQIDGVNEIIPQFEHFYGLNIPLDEVFASKYIKVRFGRLPLSSYQKLSSYQNDSDIVFVPCSSEKDFYWGMYVCPLDGEEEADRIFSMLFFERLRIPDAKGTPEETVKELRLALSEKLTRVSQLDSEIDAYLEKSRSDILSIYLRLKNSYDAFELRRYSAKFKDSFLLMGFVPAREEPAFKKYLDTLDSVEYKLENPGEAEKLSPPSKLKNCRLFSPYEYYIDLYGMPCYNELDPTAFVAITYTLIYGVMFADVGQGIILSLVGFIMHRFKKMALGKILIPCGISGALFGLVFGSVFGYENLLDPMYHLVGLAHKPVEIMNSVQNILIAAVAIGVFLVAAAIITNIFSALKQKNYGAALFGPNGIAGLLFYGTLITLLLSMVLSFSVPTLPLIIFGVALPLICMLMQNPLGKLVRREKSWLPESMGEYLIESFFELFEAVLSFITNTLSFLRVGAFVLVHAGLMMAFFILAELLGPAGFIMVLLGNAVVIALEGLLVGIQTLRLEFYEMFSRCYIGQGREFKPMKFG